MPALAIVRRDLVRLARSPLRTALLFAVPLVLATLISLAFGGDGEPDITLTVLLLDEDDSMLTRLLSGQGQVDPRLRIVKVGADGLARMERGEASALVRIPAGFTQAYLRGELATLELIKNPAERFMPRVAEEGANLGTALLSAISHVFRAELDTIATLLDDRGAFTPAATGQLAAGITARLGTLEPYVAPPLLNLEVVTVSSASGGADRPDVSPMSFIFPGLAVLGILFLAQAVTRDILRERAQGLIRHLLTAPVSVGDYLLGKTLSVVIITTLGFGLLVVIGRGMGVVWGPPGPVIALIVATAIAAGGALVLIMSIVRTERQQDAVTTIVIMLWALVGGSMVPLSALPAALVPVSRTSLNYWSIDGFNALVLQGGGWSDIGLNLLVLAGLGSLFLLIGMVRLRHALTSGDV